MPLPQPPQGLVEAGELHGPDQVMYSDLMSLAVLTSRQGLPAQPDPRSPNSSPIMGQDGVVERNDLQSKLTASVIPF